MPRRKRGPKPRHQSLESAASERGFASPVHTDCAPQHVLATPGISGPVEAAGRRTEPVFVVAQTGSLALCHQTLLSTIAGEGITPQETVKSCIGIYMESVFPLLPIICEAALRSQASLILPSCMTGMSPPQNTLTPELVASVRTYALTTALCALVAHISPCNRYPQDDTIPSLFLESSQSMLHAFLGYDITYPTSASLVIRIFQASCYQMMGNSCLSWHKINEAVRLAYQMRLHVEDSYEGLDPVEAKLRRNAFWYLYSADRSTSLLNGTKQGLMDIRLQGPLTTAFGATECAPLLDQHRPENEGRFEEYLMAGFHKDHEVWRHGFGLLFDLDLFLAANSRTSNGQSLDVAQMNSLTGSYLGFSSILDDLPEFLVSPATICNFDKVCEEHQRRAFWIQKTNIALSYHFLRMLILNRFAAVELLSLIGLSDGQLSIDWKKVEIAHEVLNLVASVPLEALLANGEPGAEKLRYICATLLEVMQGQESVQIVTRAKKHFTALLDHLSKLNSRVSEKLAQLYNTPETSS
ncbi:hypothetical protein CCMA1212_007846 [Trichoderma ghanense]|uniref:Xylanolytic transcriptional activator regulatory domain-containing protein n=1 Tax=Trichoderma ghanense TaxID=65468 RepID=A0ABY2GYL5_9HYPO